MFPWTCCLQIALSVLQLTVRPQHLLTHYDRLSAAYRSATAFRDKAQEQQRHYYDHHVRYTLYKAGDLVLIDDPANKHNKLHPRWVGPYEVLHSIAQPGNLISVDFAVRDASKPHAKTKVIHYNRMKPYVTDHSQSHTPPSPQFIAKPTTLKVQGSLAQYGHLPDVSMDNARDFSPTQSLVQPPQMPISAVEGVHTGAPVSPVTRGLHGLKTEARTRPVPEIV